MAWQTVVARRARTFVPPEAGALAVRFRTTAEKLRGGGFELRDVSRALGESWEGRSRERFMLDFGPRPGQLESVAQWLEQAARQLEATEVTVWETVEQVVWVPGPARE
jgi:uncharacterized protein YukE